MNVKKIGLLLGSMLAVILLSSLFLTVAFAADNFKGTQYNPEADGPSGYYTNRGASNIVIDAHGIGPVANGDAGSLNVGLVVRSELFSIGDSIPTETPAPTISPATEPTATFTPNESEPEPGTIISPTVPPPTFPPGTATPQVLIPVTGGDFSISGSGSGSNFWLFIYFGIGLIGTGMIFYGIATYYKAHKSK